MSRLPSLKSVWLTVAASTLLALSGVAPAQADGPVEGSHVYRRPARIATRPAPTMYRKLGTEQ